MAQLIFGSIFLIRIEPKLAIAAFAGIILVAIVSMLYGDFTRVLAQKVQELFAVSSAIAESKSIKTVTTTVCLKLIELYITNSFFLVQHLSV